MRHKLKSVDVIQIAPLLRLFDINFDQTDDTWNNKVNIEMTIALLKCLNYIHSKNSKDIFSYHHQLQTTCHYIYTPKSYNYEKSEVNLDEVDLKKEERDMLENATYGVRCNKCGMRAQLKVKGYEDNPEIWDSCCLLWTYIKAFNESESSKVEVLDLMERWIRIMKRRTYEKI